MDKIGKPDNFLKRQIEHSLQATYTDQVIQDKDLWDFVLFTPEPEIPNAIWTIEADETIQKALDEAVPAFCKEVSAGVAKMKESE